MSGRDVDRLARDIIDSAGYGKYFVHSTGHGVGLDIHEMPYISPRVDTILEDGMGLYYWTRDIYSRLSLELGLKIWVVLRRWKGLLFLLSFGPQILRG